MNTVDNCLESRHQCHIKAGDSNTVRGPLLTRARVVPLLMALALAACGDDGTIGADGADGAIGADGADGANAVARPLPTLQGHNPAVPEANFHGTAGGSLAADRILPYDVQAAYNGSTFFWRLSYNGEEGKRHQYLRYTNGVWNKEGGDRRDAQASIDGDAQQGDQGQLTTIYEQRTSIMINDPNNAATDVANFGEQGCFLSCHNGLRHMPEWTSASGHDGKYIDPAQTAGASGTPVLDLWHWRGARSNPIGRSDDQNIRSLNFVDSSPGDNGGRKGDGGTGVFFNQGLDVSGNPQWMLDSNTTAGKFAFKWDNFWTTPFFYMVQDDALLLGPLAPNPGIMSYADAVTAGYSPEEGDTVPRRIMRAGAGSRADIFAYGTTFTPTTPDSSYGLWNVQLQRAMDTGNGSTGSTDPLVNVLEDDITMVNGLVYEAGFEVHLWEYTTRDHYVSFPQTVCVGTCAGTQDINAVFLTGMSGGPEIALDINWDAIPKTRLYLFQPGITSYEFLTGNNTGKTYNDPVSGAPVDQGHGGSAAVSVGTSCVTCHTIRNADIPGAGQTAGAMEALTEQRGGIWADTPVISTTPPLVGVVADGQAKYVSAVCGVCHAAGAFDMTTAAGANDLAGTSTTTAVISGVNATMTGLPDLTAQEVVDLQAFFDSL